MDDKLREKLEQILLDLLRCKLEGDEIALGRAITDLDKLLRKPA